MSDDTMDPFAPDINTPSISSDDRPAFDFNPAETEWVTPPVAGFPWKMVSVIAGSVVALVLLILAVIYLLVPLVNPPERVVRAYYLALNAQDYTRMANCFDPDDPLSQNALPMVDNIKRYLETLVKEQLGTKMEIGWEFQGMQYKALERKGDRASVEASGRVRLFERNTNMGITLPYRYRHTMVRKQGRWYLLAY